MRVVKRKTTSQRSPLARQRKAKLVRNRRKHREGGGEKKYKRGEEKQARITSWHRNADPPNRGEPREQKEGKRKPTTLTEKSWAGGLGSGLLPSQKKKKNRKKKFKKSWPFTRLGK